MKTIIRKLSSRKLWLAIAGVATGFAAINGVSGADITSIATSLTAIAGCVTSLISIVTYIYTEGKIDAASIQKIADTAKEVVSATDNVVSVVKEAK